MHSKLFAMVKLALLRDFNQVHWMDILKVPLHHPPIPQVPLASRIWARQGSGMQRCAHHVGDRWADFKQGFGHHCLLVDVMDICQVAAERAYLQFLPALSALHVAGVPFASCDPSLLHPPIRLRRKLRPNPPWCAEHGLGLRRVCLKTDPLEQVDKNVERVLKESRIP